jgi:hypothetical protein
MNILVNNFLEPTQKDQDFFTHVQGNGFPFYLVNKEWSHLLLLPHQENLAMFGALNSDFFAPAVDVLKRFCKENSVDILNYYSGAVKCVTKAQPFSRSSGLDHVNFNYYTFIYSMYGDNTLAPKEEACEPVKLKQFDGVVFENTLYDVITETDFGYILMFNFGVRNNG